MGHLHRLAGRTDRSLTRRAAAYSALLSLLFLAVYGGCNWITSQRTDVGVWYFDWERRLPFWPAMILPYLSIDLFFVAAPFLCRDREELRVFTQRVCLAILVAGACFLLVPMRCAFERPAVDGLLGVLFNGFTELDRPFNLVPSLHVTLAVILADTYRRHTSGLVRLAMTAWFVLVGVSTVFTYQHHVIDVIGGLVLATVVLYLLRLTASAKATASPGNRRVAVYYFTGAAAIGAIAVAFRPWGALLLWPTLSLAVVSAAYAGLGTRVFGKSGGRLPLPSWLLLWPYLLGQHASWLWYRRHCRPYDAVAPRVWIGRRLNDAEAARAVAAGVAAVVDLTADFNESPVFTRLPYLNLPTLDLTAPDAVSLDRAVEFIADHSRRGVVYVHCKIGYSRSAAVAGAWLLASAGARPADEAIAAIRAARPHVVIRPEVMHALAQVEARLAGRPAPRVIRASLARRATSFLLGAAARLLCGRPRRTGSTLDTLQRIYFANHTSHLDFVAVWGSLPPELRADTRPVAGRDYWDRDPLRRFIARQLLHAVLVDRAPADASRHTMVRAARRSVQRAARALAAGSSLIIFPEGSRGSGSDVGPFKSGLYHLCRMRPDVELVPVALENMHRILPRGAVIPVPLQGRVTFGTPLRLRPGEDKAAFLARARAALVMVNRPWTSPWTLTSRAS
jgi:protein-tyrosine phosphatase/membrane-associated phospholipid phosphatase